MDTDETQMIEDGARLEYPLKDLTEKVIGAAMEVHNQLGTGFLEKVYENALVFELRSRGVEAASQVLVPVSYKGALVGDYVADLLIERCLICEIKAIRDLVGEHEAQLINYLKGTGIKVGLLLNFGRSRLQFRRFVF
jgi:GxxExxY protein